VGLFGLKSSGKVTRKLASPNAPLGYTLCLVNLVLDGYTNAAQVGWVGWVGLQKLARASVVGLAGASLRVGEVEDLICEGLVGWAMLWLVCLLRAGCANAA